MPKRSLKWFGDGSKLQNGGAFCLDTNVGPKLKELLMLHATWGVFFKWVHLGAVITVKFFLLPTFCEKSQEQ